jgi:hypothetical protein
MRLLKMIGLFVCLGMGMMGLSRPGGAVTPAFTPSIGIAAYGVTYYQKNTPLYTIMLKITGGKATKYIIERQALGSLIRVKIMERTAAEMEQSKFEYTDCGTLEKHKQYEYFLKAFDQADNTLEEVSVIGRVANLQYQDEMEKFWPVFSQNNAAFTLGLKVDPENEALEYRLYTRIPGGGGEKLLQSWRPSIDNERVMVSFTKICEWRLVCIEVDPAIVDRSESVLVDWSLFVKQ